jgi:nucleolar protein 4
MTPRLLVDFSPKKVAGPASISLYRKRSHHTMGKRKHEEGPSAETAAILPENTHTDAEAARRKHADDIAKRRTLFVRSLSYGVTSDSLSEKFSFVAPIKHATVVIDPATKESRGFGFVTLADAEDAPRAVKELNGAEFDGRKIKVELAEPRHRAPTGATAGGDASENKSALPTTGQSRPKKLAEVEKRRSPRLIVRNLPWSVKKPEQLVKVFQSYGKIKDVIIPKKRNGEMSGFAFVTMKGYKNAERAIEKVNGKEIEGRVVAVDWAVEKEEWEAKAKEQQPKEEDVEMKDGDQDGGASGSAEDSSEGDDEEGDEEEEDDEQGDEEEDDEQGDEEEDDEQGDEDESESEDMDDQDDEERPLTDSATTLFIRNLPYSATDDSVYEQFTQFGPVHYARIVMDHNTARPKGTGFVRFYDPEVANTCLREAPRDTNSNPKDKKPSLLQSEALDSDGKYTLDGRVLSVSRAVDRNEAERLTTASSKEREKANTDKRRLFLLNEGTISPSSSIWKKISPSERTLREQSRDQRRTLVQADPNLHLSLTRLSVRNIPRWVTDKDLKLFARKAIPGFAEEMKTGLRSPLSAEELSRDGGEGKVAEEARRKKGVGVVKQAKVQLEKTGGRSRGYGFIEYWSHRHALIGLRWLNGHEVPGTPPKDEEGAAARRRTSESDKKKRLIVEFAIENAKVVNRRKENEARSREIGEKKKEEMKKGGPAKGAKPGKGAKDFGKNKRKREGFGDDAVKEAKKRKGFNQKTEKKSGGGKEELAGKALKSKDDREGDKGSRTLGIIQKKRMMRRAKKNTARS